MSFRAEHFNFSSKYFLYLFENIIYYVIIKKTQEIIFYSKKCTHGKLQSNIKYRKISGNVMYYYLFPYYVF